MELLMRFCVFDELLWALFMENSLCTKGNVMQICFGYIYLQFKRAPESIEIGFPAVYCERK